MEILPSKPFVKFLDIRPIYSHFKNTLEIMNKKGKGDVMFGLSCLPMIGSNDYLYFE